MCENKIPESEKDTRAKVQEIVREMVSEIETGNDPWQLRNKLVPLLTNNPLAPWDVIPSTILDHPRVNAIYERNRKIIEERESLLNSFLEEKDLIGFSVFYVRYRFSIPKEKKREILKTYLPLRSEFLRPNTRERVKTKINDLNFEEAQKLNYKFGNLFDNADIKAMIHERKAQFYKNLKKLIDCSHFDSFKENFAAKAHILGNLQKKEILKRYKQKRRIEWKKKTVKNYENMLYAFDCQKAGVYEDLYPQEFIDLAWRNFVVAVDIESDGENIYQIGWCCHEQKPILRKDLESNPEKLKRAMAELKKVLKGKILAGHNILAWDLPVLKRYDKDIEDGAFFVWDTMIASWVLAPWECSHALLVNQNAHRADADSEATLKLLKQQICNLSVPFQEVIDNRKNRFWLLSKFFSSLPGIKNRQYPSNLPENYPKIGKQWTKIILPEWRIAEDCAWVSGIKYFFPHSVTEKEWLVLSVDRLSSLTKRNPEDVCLEAVVAVVRDADKHGVQVAWPMLPVWLRQKTEELLSDCLLPPVGVPSSEREGSCYVSSYRSWRDAPSERTRAVFEDKSTALLYSQEAEFEWLCDPKPLKTSDVQNAVGIDASAMEAETILALDDSASYASLTHLPDENYRHWLLFNPACKHTEGKSNWQLCSRQISPSPTAFADEKLPSDGTSHFNAALLSWWAQNSSPTPLLRDFVPPSSGNRLAYWQDAISRVLSIAEADDAILVLLLQNDCEVNVVREALAAIGQTIIVADSVLRRLERLRHGNCRVTADSIINARQWLAAAEELKCEVQLVVEALPLHLWWMCLNLTDQSETSVVEENSTSSGEDANGNTGDEESTEIETEHDVDLHADDAAPWSDASRKKGCRPVALSGDAVELCIRRFLNPWLASVLKMDKPARPPIILDSRLDAMRLDHSEQKHRRDTVFHPLDENVSSRLLSALRDNFGDLERTSAPADYEAYQAFLKRHWGYDDFKPDTQRPAIEAIRENKADVLVRLPTGEGKSVLFQVPALLRGAHTKRLTIVITPLRALMADQVRTLWGKGFFQSVDYLSADRDRWVSDEVYQGVIDNRIKLLFVAPERFRVERFQEAIQRRHENDQGFEYLVVDEAHCVSQWGFEFRPDYLFAMREIRNAYRKRTDGSLSRLLFFSATVTEADRHSLEQESGIEAGPEYAIRPEEQRHPVRDFIRLHTVDTGTALFGNGAVVSRLGQITRIINEMDLTQSAVLVFVTRRRHAEQLSYQLYQAMRDGSIPPQAMVRYFHAGLPALERLEVYDELSSGQANVLVATKAFGMGMDIPHIHACIHLAPPSYLEDYLQEVGRTGRGEKERDAAGLTYVDCTLLYDRSDFDENHTKLQENKTTEPILIDLWNHIYDLSRAIAGTERRVCILPTDGVKDLKPTPLRRALFWLERSGRLQIRGFLPGLLKLRLKRTTLEQSRAEQGEDAEVARALLVLYEEPTAPPSSATPDMSGGLVDSALSFAKGIVGILLRSPPATKKEDNKSSEESKDKIVSNIESQWDEAEIQLNSIWRRTNLPRVDDVLRALSDLQGKGGVQIVREIEFEQKPYRDNQAQMWEWLDTILAKILKETPETGREMTPEEICSWLGEGHSLPPPANWTKQMARVAQKRIVRSAVKLCAAATVRIREQVSDAQELIYRYSLARGRLPFVKRRVKELRNLAKRIAELLNDKTTLSLSDILACCEGRVRLNDVGAALRLLSNLGLYANRQEVLAYSYVIEVLNSEPLPSEADCAEESYDRRMFEDLQSVNRMSELRSHAMALYALVPDELRKGYVDEYFLASTPEELEDLLGRTHGAIDEEKRRQNEYLNELMERIRGQALNDRIDGNPEKDIPALNDEQKQACTYSYGEHLLVNAGPGAGKTHVLMLRCAHLIHEQDIRPREILVLAFNRAVVHEIRERITRLFSALGYGSYVKQLHVYTFHAFALRTRGSQDAGMTDDETFQDLLHKFAEQLDSNPSLQSKVSGYKAILVDEFQDMNEDFYRVIRAIQHASGAGLMVIGDDDQDILLWNREQNNNQSYLHACQYFLDFQHKHNYTPEEIFLKKNYRSRINIVERSQKLATEKISALYEQRNNNLARLKEKIQLEAAKNEHAAAVEKINNTDIDSLCKKIIEESEKNPKSSMAVLCRSNAETWQVYEKLQNMEIKVRVQNSNDLTLAKYKEIAEWLEVCQRKIDENEDSLLIAESIDETLWKNYKKLGLPGNCFDNVIKNLWSLTIRDNPRARLSDHIDFVESLKTSDYTRMTGKHDLQKENAIIVSTIHKVKGLEFDIVFMKSSSSPFPYTNNEINIVDNALDEARLFYVGMTRAKYKLFFQWGERENKWCKSEEYKGLVGARFLEGTLKEVFISWPGYADQVKKELQEYLCKHVKINDQVTATKKGAIRHGAPKSETIGILDKSYRPKKEIKLSVVAVYRSPVDDKLEAKHPGIWKDIHQSMKDQGWLYTVLVRGRL